jgi:hypothetical protein
MIGRHLLLAIAIAACGPRSAAPTPVTQTDLDARALALRVIDALERDDVDGWWELQSARVQRGTDRAEAGRLFASWKRFLVPHAQSLRNSDWTIASDTLRFRAVGRQPERLARVVVERGGLRIDEHHRRDLATD